MSDLDKITKDKERWESSTLAKFLSKVQERKAELLREVEVTLQAIRALAEPGVNDPFTDPATLTRAVTAGVLDAPHLRNNPFARGEVATRTDPRGACVAVDPDTGGYLSERVRLAGLGIDFP